MQGGGEPKKLQKMSAPERVVHLAIEEVAGEMKRTGKSVNAAGGFTRRGPSGEEIRNR